MKARISASLLAAQAAGIILRHRLADALEKIADRGSIPVGKKPIAH